MTTTRQRFLLLPACLLLTAAAATLSAQTSLSVNPASISLSALTGSTSAVSQQLTIGIASTSSAPQNVLITPLGAAWLSVSPQTASVSPGSPAAVTVSANPTGLATGAQTGSLRIDLAGAVNSPVTVPVTLNVGPISAQSTPIAFTYQQGASLPPAQALQVNAAAATNFTAAAGTTSGGNWLQVAPTSGTAPQTVLSVSLNSSVLASLAAGNYTGAISLTAQGASAVQVPVTLAVTTAPQLSASPAGLSYAFQTGGTNNVTQQNIALSSSGGPLAFTYAVAGAWLSVTPSSNATPATLAVTVNPGGMPAGSYAGSITVTAPGAANDPLTIPVSLLVSATPIFTATPAALTYNWQFGTAPPTAQTIQTSSTGAAISYTTAVSANTAWLGAAPAAGSTPAPVTVSVDPSSLTPGSYTGTISITPAGGTAQTVAVTLNVSGSPIPVINAGSPLVFNYQLNQSQPPVQTVQVASSTGAPLNLSVSATTSSGGNWLFVTPSLGATPANLAISVQTAGMAPGAYDGDITVNATIQGAGTPAAFPATLHVKYFVSNFAMLNVATSTNTPGLLSLTAGAGGTPTLTLSSTNVSIPLHYTAVYAAAPGSPLVVTLSSTSAGSGPQISFLTPDTVSVIVQPPAAPGQYSGTITLSATDPTTGQAVPNGQQVVNVRFLVPAGTLSVSPAAGLRFAQTLGAAAPAAQALQVNAAGAAVNFSVSTSTDVTVPWLKVTPTSGTTNASVSVSVDATNLSPGTYQGTVSILAPGAAGSPVAVPVVFTVSAAGTLSAAPATLPFVAQAGGAAPASQTVQVSSSSTVDYTVTAATSDNGKWLKVAPASGTLTAGVAAALSVSVDPAGLAAGNYTGTLSIAAAGATNSPQVVQVTLQVQGLPVPTLSGLSNAASGVSGAVSPGELVSIYGANLGPATLTGLQLTASGMVSTNVAGVQVFFDNVAAPLTAIVNRQINAVVPYEVAGKPVTKVTVVFNGQTSAVLQVPVVAAMPGVFTQSMSGSGPGAILNFDPSTGLSLNTSANKARKSSTVVIYATGEGQTNPPGVTGMVMPATALAHPVQPITVLIGGVPATVTYAGSAPTLVAGVLQVNAVVPDDAPSGDNVPVLIISGGTASSQQGVTLSIR